MHTGLCHLAKGAELAICRALVALRCVTEAISIDIIWDYWFISSNTETECNHSYKN